MFPIQSAATAPSAFSLLTWARTGPRGGREACGASTAIAVAVVIASAYNLGAKLSMASGPAPSSGVGHRSTVVEILQSEEREGSCGDRGRQHPSRAKVGSFSDSTRRARPAAALVCWSRHAQPARGNRGRCRSKLHKQPFDRAQWLRPGKLPDQQQSLAAPQSCLVGPTATGTLTGLLLNAWLSLWTPFAFTVAVGALISLRRLGQASGRPTTTAG